MNSATQGMVIAITPASGRTQMTLAVAYQRLGRMDEAKAAMAEALRVRPGSNAVNVRLPLRNASPAFVAASNESWREMVLLGLPDHVFPVAGLGFGWPSRRHHVSLRLPLSATVHRDRFSEAGIEETVDAYDRRRAAVAPIRAQRATDVFGTADFYGWSEDKVRQYATPERADWGAFVRKKGFRLE